ncbi:MAG: LysE family translocator [Kiloniellales bacterium]
MSFENWITFVVIWPVVCLGVGPNSVVCAAAGAINGFARGVWSAVGIASAGLLHSMIAAFGFSSLMLAWSGGYTTLKWLGVAYLVWLGFRLWLKPPVVIDVVARGVEGRTILFRRAFLISLSNPQAFLTYMAFFVPAIDPTSSLFSQLVVLIPTAVGVVFAMYVGYVLLGTPLARAMTTARRQRVLARTTGSFYLLSASILAVSDMRR